jgi:DmsE family decaheme c-type cytochrome
MTIFRRRVKDQLRRFAAFAWIILWCGAIGAWAQGSAAKPAAPPNLADPTGGSTYVGSDVCKTCHEDQFKNIDASPHYRTNLPKIRGEEVHGCESCHGAGSAHVAGGGDKTKIFIYADARPEAVTRRCLACHEANLEQRQFMRSTHNENGVTCTSCHSVHHSTLEHLLVKKQTALCFSCHAEQKADFQKPFHHPVEEGLVQCNDCHNPHGTLNARQLRSTPDQDAVCFKCHSDKRGPFVFEHEPVKVEGCTTCHFPHGSTNPRMLTSARTNSLCLQCHAATSAIGHTQNSRIQQCIDCHSNIHGSNLSNVFFK